MKCPKSLVLVLVLSSLTAVKSLPSGTTTARSPTQIGETIKQLTNQLMDVNATSPDVITLDTRTPPKIKQHAKKKNKIPPETMENSHAGVAIPVNEEEINLEETTKKLTFYKIEKPTTNSGLSTWILLSGQATPKPSRKPIIKPNEIQNITLVIEPNKIIKPIFKKRITTTTAQPSTVTTTKANPTKLTKVKASVLNNAISKKVPQTTTPTTTTTKKTTSTTKKTTVSVKTSTATTTTPSTVITQNVTVVNSTDSEVLPVEAKEGESDLVSSDDKKTRRPSNKRKKNKNRRRRPSEKNDNTKLEKQTKTKEKPIGTQLYNYLSREVMPTVGVGLVGLMVTAGLASYFLYPFGAARRSYEVDRKDKEGIHYYYNDEYSGGIAEEEAIGKVIAGMPSNSLFGNNFKTPTSRHSFNNLRNRQSYDYQPITYNNNKDIIEQSKETGYTIDDQKFVVGNIPTEEITPAAVPEHGPRSLHLRKRRDLPEVINVEENEIDNTDETGTITTSTSTMAPPVKMTSLIDIFRELFHLKVRLGLQLLQNATQAVSQYVSHVQRRLDQHYKNYTLHHD